MRNDTWVSEFRIRNKRRQPADGSPDRIRPDQIKSGQILVYFKCSRSPNNRKSLSGKRAARSCCFSLRSKNEPEDLSLMAVLLLCICIVCDTMDTASSKYVVNTRKVVGVKAQVCCSHYSGLRQGSNTNPATLSDHQRDQTVRSRSDWIRSRRRHNTSGIPGPKLVTET